MSGETIEELEAVYAAARDAVIDIQTQLAQRKPIGKIDDAEYIAYREWAGRAHGALRHRLVDLRNAKAALKDARREFLSNTNASNPAVFSDLLTAQGLIRASLATIKGLAKEVELEPEEQATVYALQNWLSKNGVAP